MDSLKFFLQTIDHVYHFLERGRHLLRYSNLINTWNKIRYATVYIMCTLQQS